MCVNIETKQNVKGCDEPSLGDTGVLEEIAHSIIEERIGCIAVSSVQVAAWLSSKSLTHIGP